MLAKMISASYDTSYGRVLVKLDTSTQAGYPNQCEQYQSYGYISVPLPHQLVEASQQSLAEVHVTGYNNQISDTKFSLNPGESSNYGQNWYNTNATTGLYIQEAKTTHAENHMMGQSTNEVLLDILNYLVALDAYLQIHTHSGCGGEVSSGVAESYTPVITPVSDDVTYISDSNNLAITGDYNPHPSLTSIDIAAIYAKLKALS